MIIQIIADVFAIIVVEVAFIYGIAVLKEDKKIKEICKKSIDEECQR